jgi:hypothetical protein
VPLRVHVRDNSPVVHFTTITVSRMLGSSMNLEGSGRGLIDILSQQVGETEETTKNPSG